ncbi:hypothetical protein BDQ12DRAFT_612199 [Crucibulum laeve]|uniref:DUF6534 domain-containing protein n=1 Tax=Crucibulum laeve TaxID=68775 RepID=A0A5C3M2C3_9AGAR|nr:hypothetical protein BDQ12DRAFT_612199 [Crucibulum laeve]
MSVSDIIVEPSFVVKAYATDKDLTLGPLVIAVVLNSFLYGVCVLQFSTYWASDSKDNITIRSLVAWVFLLDTFHSCSLVYMLWVYVVDNFNNPNFLTRVLWPFSTTPIVTTLTSFPIQVYLSWRIKGFSGSIRVFIYLMVLAFAQTALGFACSISAIPLKDITTYRKLIPFVDAWQVLTVACDVSITVLLSWYLSKSRTGIKRSDNVIARVIQTSIETAAFGAFFCIMDLITFTSLLQTNLHVIFAFPMGRIYT